jgi:uncharacterized membrane protein
MSKGRLEAFSDGVIAIIITIMVLELKAPHDFDFASLIPLLPIFASYLISFVFIGIYWNNHHHLLQAAKQVNGSVLWANLHLLFWLSLIPFVTSWMGETWLSSAPVASYAFVGFMAGFAYYLLVGTLRRIHAQESILIAATGSSRKEFISLVAYLIAIPIAFVSPFISFLILVLVAVIWFIPDRRIEDRIE